MPHAITRKIAGSTIRAAGFTVLRTPLYPLRDFLKFGQGLHSPEARGQGPLAKAHERDRKLLRRRLDRILARPEFAEAVFLGSPALQERIDAWRAKPTGEEGRRLERALYKYFARSAGRPTPFGLFAGCSLARFGPATRLTLAPLAEYRRHSRLDMNYISELVLEIEQDEKIRPVLRFFPNPSIYTAAGRTRYIEFRVVDNARIHHLVAVDQNDYLDLALARAVDGAKPAELAAAIHAHDPEIDLASAGEFIEELITSQLLISELTLNVTGPDVVVELLDKLGGQDDSKLFVNGLGRAHRALGRLDRAGLGHAPDKYRRLAKGLEKLPAKIEPSTLIQVDMFKPLTDSVFGERLVKEVLRGVEFLHRLTPDGEAQGLARFREDFQRRYEDQELPLVEVLDEEVGIGYQRSNAPQADEAPLLKGLPLGGRAVEERFPRDHRLPILLRLLERAQGAKALEIELADQDIRAMTPRELKPLPGSLAAMGTVISHNRKRIDRGDYRIYLSGAFGPPGTRLLGRFCHLDRGIEEAVAAHARSEEELRPEAVYAEIVHLPEGRIGNILFRPILREHELPILGRSTLPSDKQIPLTDLLVSVRRDRIVLRSRRLDREVIPRLSSAHNYSGPNIGLYKFLCSLQGQNDSSGATWTWGSLGDAPFLPRVTHGPFIFSLATWKIRRDVLDIWKELDGPRGYAAVQKWRKQVRAPRYLELADRDNRLPLDLDNPLSCDVLLNYAGKRDWLELKEMLPGQDGLIIAGPEGLFTHEFIIPLEKVPEQKKPSSEAAPRARPAVGEARPARLLVPGSNWLYAKLYCGTSDADFLLRELVAPLVTEALAEGWCERWFFIRFSDPDWHLRLRFCGAPAALTGKLLPRLHALAEPTLAAGRLHGIVLDSYRRETSRYGGPAGIELAEQYFLADSEAVLTVVNRLQGDTGSDDRWRLGMLGLDRLLEDFGLDLKRKLKVMESMAKGFGQEFGFNKHVMKQVGGKFREERDKLLAVLAGDPAAGPFMSYGPAAFNRRRELAAEAVAGLQEAEKADSLNMPLEEMLSSLCHMHSNRILRSAARAQEAVMYNFLTKIYTGELKRKK